MNLICVSLTTLSVLLLPLHSDSRSILGPNKINIINGDDNYEIRRYDLVNGGTGYALQRFANDIALNVIKNNNAKLENPELRFQKSEYEIDTCQCCIGIIGHFLVITTSTTPIVFGLSSNDVYINKVFRVGPDSGLLYADSNVNIGRYNFNVTADTADQKLHAVAKVFVNVNNKNLKKNENNDVNLKSSNISYKVIGIKITKEENLLKNKADYIEEKFSYPQEGEGNINTNEIYLPSFRKLWYKLLKKGFNSGLQYTDIKDLLERSQPPSENEGNRVFSSIFPINTRHRRAVSPSQSSTAPSFSKANAASYTSSVQSSKIVYQESAFADIIMSAFVLFVVSFATLFFFGSIFYFAYKRLKKCGDYAVDEDAKSTSKQATDDETVYSTIQSDLKNPNILSIPEISQNRVVDSIEITKQKLSNGQPSVFTIQKSYEESEKNLKHDDEVYIIDMEQSSVGTEFYRILHKSNSASTPTITATFVDEQINFPQSILTTSRRNSISSIKKDGSSLGSVCDLNEDGQRRKSVTFSDIVELYHG